MSKEPDHRYLANCIEKLKALYPDSPEWIMNRASEIQDEFWESQKKHFLKDHSPFRAAFWRPLLDGMAASMDMFPSLDNSRQAMRRRFQRTSLSDSFNASFNYMRQATADFIILNDVPLSTFGPNERHYLFPSGIPAKTPSAAIN